MTVHNFIVYWRDTNGKAKKSRYVSAINANAGINRIVFSGGIVYRLVEKGV